ncbi:amino acid permease-domain-containing protein [Stachybotrys elegans]|uniref:Amino acid permease-domain-containing protein n=1 Tax=Stachybotrys elegans TaxID=80388 RepID=A0A8K0WJH9_9HYPO|nr:amino acid permease-domain-containing protein [Stachybotrys elegans]
MSRPTSELITDWIPDWVQSRPVVDQLGDSKNDIELPPIKIPERCVPIGNDVGILNLSDDSFTRVTKSVLVTTNPNRTVHRKLRGIHLFMISLNGTLGAGLYWRGGLALEVGGALNLVLSFLLVGILAWAVMQCIAEMLCVWPIPGALSVYVRTFVDDELGIVVGLTYWFTYSVSFAALLVTVAAEAALWIDGNNVIYRTITYLIIPFILVLINAVEVGIFGWIEVAFGSIKLVLLTFIIATLVAIRVKEGNITPWDANKAIDFDRTVASDLPTALLIAISITIYAYVGIEIVAASAVEARATTSSTRASKPEATTVVGQRVRFSAIYFPLLAAAAYTLSSMLASFSIPRDHCRLPRLNPSEKPGCDQNESNLDSTSVFVIVARESGIQGLEHAFNGIIIFTALTCANTNLYVASRSLFGLTTRLEGGSRQPLYIRLLALFGKTNRRKVPIRAVVFSAMAFCWVPLIQLIGNNSTTSNTSIEILGQMGSVGVIIVWTCECLAFIRYYHCITKHQKALDQHRIPRVRRHDYQNDDYPYRSHAQPFLAYAALTGCLLTLMVASSSALWKGFRVETFLSSYLIVTIFLVIWLALKIFRGGKLTPVDLSNADRIIDKIRNLHDICFEANLVVSPTGVLNGSQNGTKK